MSHAERERGFAFLEALVASVVVAALVTAAFGLVASAGRDENAGETAALEGVALHNARTQLEALVRYDRRALAALVPARWSVAAQARPSGARTWAPADSVTFALSVDRIHSLGGSAAITFSVRDPLGSGTSRTSSLSSDIPQRCDPALRGSVC